MLSGALRRPVFRAPTRTLSYQITRNAVVSAVAHSIQETHFQRQGPNAPLRDEFWRRVPAYENVSSGDFLSYRWGVSTSQSKTWLCAFIFTRGLLTNRGQIQNTVQGKHKLERFLDAVVADHILYGKDGTTTQSKQDFMHDVISGVDAATMSIRVTFVLPYPSSPF